MLYQNTYGAEVKDTMDIALFVQLLEDNQAATKVTKILIEKYNDDNRYLPTYDVSELWDIVDDTTMEKIARILGVSLNNDSLYDKLSLALKEARPSSLRVILDLKQRSHANILYDPRGYENSTLITKEFVEYVLRQEKLSPLGVVQWGKLLKQNNIDFIPSLPELQEPKDTELLEVIFEGLLRMAQEKPTIFHREVSAVMKAKGIDPKKYTRTTMYDVIKDAKIIAG
ncbi:MAG: hypothetical protein H9W81_12570 [Enterococcus sp.]|nr:hypothetical protein [Enterococcus sp.]